MVITPLVMFRELDDLTALIQGVSIGVTVSGTAKIKINGKLHELRPNLSSTRIPLSSKSRHQYARRDI